MPTACCALLPSVLARLFLFAWKSLDECMIWLFGGAGVKMVVVDGPDSWARGMVEEGLATKFIAVDMRDADTVFERTLAAIQVRPARVPFPLSKTTQMLLASCH